MAFEAIGEDTSDSSGTVITASASVDTYGSYTELVASTGIATERITVTIVQGLSGSGRGGILEFATGAASSETPLFEVHHVASSFSFGSKNTFEFPVTIASGTRIAARFKSGTGSSTIRVAAILNSNADYGTATQLELAGVSNSEGTAINAGGTADTKGSWTELISSTSHDYTLLIVTIGRNQNTVINSGLTHLVDIGTGAASSETVLIPDIQSAFDTLESGCVIAPFYTDVSSGTRIAARCQSSSTDSADRICDVTVLGVNVVAPSGGGTIASSFMT